MPTFQNFFYDSSRQGYDVSAWRTVFGSPGVQGGNLILQQAAAVHLADCMRGEFSFLMNIPNSPAGGESRRFGLYSPNLGAYAWFSIEGETLKGQASDGTTSSESSSLTWDSTWSGADIKFTIRWESGLVKFYVAGRPLATLSGDSVPKTPLAIYLSNANTDFMQVGHIDARGMQSFYLNIDHSDTVFAGGQAYVSEAISITESATIDPTMLPSLVSDSASITENISNSLTILPALISESNSITENVVQTQIFNTDLITESITITENVSPNLTIENSSSESVTISENVAVVGS